MHGCGGGKGASGGRRVSGAGYQVCRRARVVGNCVLEAQLQHPLLHSPRLSVCRPARCCERCPS